MQKVKCHVVIWNIPWRLKAVQPRLEIITGRRFGLLDIKNTCWVRDETVTWDDVIDVMESRQCHGGPVGKRLKSLQVTDDLNQSWPKPSENQSEGRYDGALDNESDGD